MKSERNHKRGVRGETLAVDRIFTGNSVLQLEWRALAADTRRSGTCSQQQGYPSVLLSLCLFVLIHLSSSWLIGDCLGAT